MAVSERYRVRQIRGPYLAGMTEPERGIHATDRRSWLLHLRFLIYGTRRQVAMIVCRHRVLRPGSTSKALASRGDSLLIRTPQTAAMRREGVRKGKRRGSHSWRASSATASAASTHTVDLDAFKLLGPIRRPATRPQANGRRGKASRRVQRAYEVLRIHV